MSSTSRKVPLGWEELELAVERNSPGIDSYLHLPTGAVLTISSEDPDIVVKKRQISDAVNDYLKIEPASSREQYRWMETFVGSVGSPDDDTLRKRLRMAIDGKGAFRRFKDVLLGYPSQREHWFEYRSTHLRWHIKNWLKTVDIEPTIPAPWGDPSEPEELPQVSLESSVEQTSPGDPLRREATQLIESLAVLDLPTAIAFLEFLKSRSNTQD